MIRIPPFGQNTSIRTIFCSALVLIIVALCYLSRHYLTYSIVAIILLFTVSIFAVTLDFIPVIIASSLSALALNYFFIPPLYTLHISNTNDALLFSIFFAVSIVNVILTHKIRKAQSDNRDKKEKEKTIQLYNTLLNSLSHELRTPLSTITASVDALNYTPHHLSDDQQRTLLNQIQIAGNRLNEQIENLLNMSRLESGMLKLKPIWCDIHEIIFDIINTIDSIPQNIEFYEDNKLPLILVDEGIFVQILQNLIGNAIRHTPPNTCISIHAEVSDEEYLRIRVEDNGYGLPEEVLPRLFDKFYRPQNSAKGGTGLGLSIVKGYVTALGGSATVRQNNPSGLIFEVVLPMKFSYINKLKNE